jgi:hypothetical protein
MAVLAFLGGSHVGPGRLRPAVDAAGANGSFEHMDQLPELLEAWDDARGC